MENNEYLKLSNYVKWTRKYLPLDNSVFNILFDMELRVDQLIDIFDDSKIDKDWEKTKDRLGTILFDIAKFCQMNDLDLQDIILRNISKMEEKKKKV